MHEFLHALGDLTYWETFLVLWVGYYAFQIIDRTGKWVLDHTVGPWFDDKGERLAAWIERKHKRHA